MASGISKSVYAIEDLFEKLPDHWMWFPAIGAMAIGITGYFAPEPWELDMTISGIAERHPPLIHVVLPLSSEIYIMVGFTWKWNFGGTLAPLFTIGGAWVHCLEWVFFIFSLLLRLISPRH